MVEEEFEACLELNNRGDIMGGGFGPFNSGLALSQSEFQPCDLAMERVYHFVVLVCFFSQPKLPI